MAGVASRREPPSVVLRPSEAAYFVLAPIDSAARADLERGGHEPAQVEQEFAAELRYRFALRRQEEARDSVAAAVTATLTVRRFLPGAGNAGAYASYALVLRRPGRAAESLEWTWEVPAAVNVPSEFARVHFVRGAASGVMGRIKERPSRDTASPPPLQLLF